MCHWTPTRSGSSETCVYLRWMELRCICNKCITFIWQYVTNWLTLQHGREIDKAHYLLGRVRRILRKYERTIKEEIWLCFTDCKITICRQFKNSKELREYGLLRTPNFHQFQRIQNYPARCWPRQFHTKQKCTSSELVLEERYKTVQGWNQKSPKHC